jgi:hypothetical protein
MEWWFKSEKLEVTADKTFIMQDAIKSVLRDGKSMATVCFYTDANYFYIKTSNKICLNHFFFQHGFEEMEEDAPLSEISLVN